MLSSVSYLEWSESSTQHNAAKAEEKDRHTILVVLVQLDRTAHTLFILPADLAWRIREVLKPAQ